MLSESEYIKVTLLQSRVQGIYVFIWIFKWKRAGNSCFNQFQKTNNTPDSLDSNPANADDKTMKLT